MSYLTDLKNTHLLEINLIKDMVSFKSGMVFINGNSETLYVGTSTYLIKLDQKRHTGFIYEILIPMLSKLFKDLNRDNVKSYQMRLIGKRKDFKTETSTPNVDGIYANSQHAHVLLKLTRYVYLAHDNHAINILKPKESNGVNDGNRYLIDSKFFKDIAPNEINSLYEFSSNELKSYGNMFYFRNQIHEVKIILAGMRQIEMMEVL
jgi:hypothetical protein